MCSSEKHPKNMFSSDVTLSDISVVTMTFMLDKSLYFSVKSSFFERFSLTKRTSLLSLTSSQLVRFVPSFNIIRTSKYLKSKILSQVVFKCSNWWTGCILSKSTLSQSGLCNLCNLKPAALAKLYLYLPFTI